MEVLGVEQDPIPYVNSWNFPMFLLRDESLNLIYTASLVVLVMSFHSLTIIEKLSTLV